MDIGKRKLATIGLSLLILAGMPLVWAGLSRLWYREIETASFTWDRIDFEGFITNSWAGMASQTEILGLTENGETYITITKTDYGSDMLLDIIYTCEAGEAVLVVTGQFCQFLYRPPDNPEEILPTNEPFDIPTDGTSFSINTNRMAWYDPMDVEGEYCRALKLTFYMDTSQMTIPDGTYTYDISVGIWFDDEA